MNAGTTKSDTLYLELRDAVVRRNAGERFWSIREIMKRYKVSQLIVDQTVNRLREEGFLVARPGRGLFVQSAGPERFDASGRASTVLVMTPRWVSVDIEEIARTVDACNRNGGKYELRMEQFDFLHAVPRDLEAASRNLAGLIILPSGENLDSRDIAAIHSYMRNCPTVVLNRHLDEMNIVCVGLDDAFAGQLAAHHLARNGHRRIGVLISEPHNRTIMARVRGVQDYALLHDLELEILDCRVQSGEAAAAKTYRYMAQRITGGLGITGLIGVSGESILGAVNACHNGDLRVPEALSIVAITGEELTATYFPPLDTVAGQLPRQLLLAIEQIDRAGRDDFHNSYLKTELIERGSVQCLKQP